MPWVMCPSPFGSLSAWRLGRYYPVMVGYGKCNVSYSLGVMLPLQIHSWYMNCRIYDFCFSTNSANISTRLSNFGLLWCSFIVSTSNALASSAFSTDLFFLALLSVVSLNTLSLIWKFHSLCFIFFAKSQFCLQLWPVAVPRIVVASVGCFLPLIKFSTYFLNDIFLVSAEQKTNADAFIPAVETSNAGFLSTKFSGLIYSVTGKACLPISDLPPFCQCAP